MTAQYWVSLFAVMQGAFVFGLSVFLFAYYLPKKKSHLKSNSRWHVILVVFSYILLTAATVQTAAFWFYNWGNVWYWMISIAYLSGDIALVFILRDVAKRDRLEILNGNDKQK